MSKKEVHRAGLVKACLAGKITNEEGAEALRISVRQFKRLKALHRKGGCGALVHQLRGRPGNRKLVAGTRERVIDLLKTTYAGFNDTHLSEKLRECEGLSLSRETVRRIRGSLGIPAQRPRRPPKHRARRLREGREGALVQIDGSPFDWLEGRGPWMTLVGAIDDASGRILGATFRPHEDLHGYATLFQQLFITHGLPLELYGDGSNILVRNDKRWTVEEELRGEQSPTHLGRLLRELGIKYVRAHSPQAKGRIEKLWATLQDRLTSELRLRGIGTLEESNAFLPEFIADYNTRFTAAPREVSAAWRRPPRDLPFVLSCRYERVVSADNTVSLPGHRESERNTGPLECDLKPGRPAAPPRLLQIPPGPRCRSYARCRVELRELLDGRLIVLYRNEIIASQLSPSDFILAPRGRPRVGCKSSSNAARLQTKIVRRRTSKPRRPPSPMTHKPAASHPWRRRFKPPRRPDTSPEGVTFLCCS